MKTEISLSKQELTKIVDIVNKLKNDFDFNIKIIQSNKTAIGSILYLECKIELNGIKGNFRTEISGVETW